MDFTMNSLTPLGRILPFLALMICISLALVAQNQMADTKSAELFRQIWSPYCPGVSLMECPSSQAQELRDELRKRLAEGETSETLLKEVYQRFGTRLRMEPKTEGREALAYFIPWSCLFAGILAVIGFWWSRRRKMHLAPSIAAESAMRSKTESKFDQRINRDLEAKL